jgi:hypothetical protein
MVLMPWYTHCCILTPIHQAIPPVEVRMCGNVFVHLASDGLLLSMHTHCWSGCLDEMPHIHTPTHGIAHILSPKGNMCFRYEPSSTVYAQGEWCPCLGNEVASIMAWYKSCVLSRMVKRLFTTTPIHNPGITYIISPKWRSAYTSLQASIDGVAMCQVQDPSVS